MGFSRKVESRERNHFRECLFSTHPEQDLQLVTHTYDARLSRIKVRKDERYSLLPLECIISVSVRQFITASQLKASGPNAAPTTTHLVHSSVVIPRRLRSCSMPSDKIHNHHMNKNVDAISTHLARVYLHVPVHSFTDSRSLHGGGGVYLPDNFSPMVFKSQLAPTKTKCWHRCFTLLADHDRDTGNISCSGYVYPA